MEITLNEPRRLFVLGDNTGHSCLGYDVVFNHCRELAKRIRQFGILEPGVSLAPVLESQIGSLEQYQQYRDLVAMVGDRKIGTWFDFNTPAKVRSVLERARKERLKVRLFYGDRSTGRSWMDEYDMLGRVGRSTGQLQIPLLIEVGEYGGAGILDSCIVRILDATTHDELYRATNYHTPAMEIRAADAGLVDAGYTHGVWVEEVNGTWSNHSNFKSFGSAAQWVAFMTGDCTEQPA